jgi:predicted ATP-binding protein involved in virulence
MNSILRLDHLQLQNFRCFGECQLDLHESLTVLVAENGQGKTALLEAISTALGAFVDGVTGISRFHGIKHTDVRFVKSETGMVPVFPTSYVAAGSVGGQGVSWASSLSKITPHARSTTKESKELRLLAKHLPGDSTASSDSETVSEQPRYNLPFVAFYGTGRLWSEHKLMKERREHAIASTSRLSGYSNCLSSSSSFKEVVAWYGNKMGEIGDARFATGLSEDLALVSAIRQAVSVVLEPTGWKEINWDSDQRSIVVEHPERGKLPLAAMSDGVQNMIALVADIAHRCARLNPHMRQDAAKETSGILLVDEIDMHLHPRWQQLIIDLLRAAFPSFQIILTTHSPHVLSTVNKECIRVIRLIDGENRITVPTMQTRGVMSADILAAIMGVDPVPQIREATMLTNYRALIEDGEAESDDALKLKSQLIAHFGEVHPLMLDCDRLIRFQAFRLKRRTQGDGEGE